MVLVDDVVDVVQRWRECPLVFVREALGAKPTAQQEGALEAFGKAGARVAIRSGHGTGKSTLMAWLILWGLTVFENVKIPVTAPTGHQLEDVIWSEVRFWRGRLPEPWRGELVVNQCEVRYERCSGFAVARTGRADNPEALQGFHSENLIFLIDEASGVADNVFEVARGALSTVGARVLMCGNPTRNSGYFYEAFHRNCEFWDGLRFSCLDSPLVGEGYADEVAREFGVDSDVYRVRVLGEFPKGSDLQFISLGLVDEAMRRKVLFEGGACVMGVDVARFGDDKSAVVLRRGRVAHVLWEGRGLDLMALADVVGGFVREYDPDGLFVDVTGIGAGVVDRLVQLGVRAIGVNFGGSSSSGGCANKRAEMWFRMKRWLEDGGILPDSSVLRDELCAPMFGYNAQDRLILERKEDMKRRGVASPDLADALALTFAMEVFERDGGMMTRDAVCEFDPFGGL